MYEQLGGFLPQLHFVADWEMWQRIASQFPFCFEPSILACYRLHPNSATSRIRHDATDARDIREMIDLTMTYHTPARGRMLARKARLWWAEAAVFHARELLVKVGFAPAWRQIIEALRLSQNRRVIRNVFSVFRLVASNHGIATQTVGEVEIIRACSEPSPQMMEISIGEGKVSIVIPCYNQGAMLRQALASIEQVRNENLLEVIVVDDGSSEVETKRILSEVLQAGYCVVSQSNRGLGAARNAGIRLAKGEFILPLDSDNRLRDAYLNEAVSLLKRNPSLGCNLLGC